MTTSGTINQTLTAGEVVRLAMGAGGLGILSSGEQPTGDETSDALMMLSFMLKGWASDGINLWRETEGSATFAGGSSVAVLAPYALDVSEARLVQTSTFERPLQRYEAGQYAMLPNKAQTGSPVAYKLTKGVSALSMTLWPVPAQNVTVRYTYSRIAEDVTDAAQTLDIPQEWLEAVWMNLASRIASGFGATRIDPATVQRVDALAAMLYQKLQDQDRPASVFMGPSYSGGWGYHG